MSTQNNHCSTDFECIQGNAEIQMRYCLLLARGLGTDGDRFAVYLHLELC